MVTTRSEDARRPRDLQNRSVQDRSVQDDAGTSNDPQATTTLLNEQIARITKSMEDLAEHNAALLSRILEQSHTNTNVCDGIPKVEREGRNSPTDGRQGEELNPSHNREDTCDRVGDPE